ncbi:MAG: Nif3-like dinuclear metal center hexameric protein [Candidatus Nitrosocaldaceae archaeon]
MNTEEIMNIALNLANMSDIPADSAIHVHGSNIKRVLLTIDVDPSIIMLAKEMKYDAVIAHHPLGKSMLNFHRVFDRHVEYMVEHGIDEALAKDAVNRLKQRVSLNSHTSIYTHVVAIASLLKMPLLNIHLPCDELMRLKIKDTLMKSDIRKVSDIIESISTIEEFKNADTKPMVVYGDADNNVNRYALVVAAGTNGGADIAKLYYIANIDTVIYLHISNDELTKLRSSIVNGNLVILGHLAGDSIGLNILADELEKHGLEVTRLGIISRNLHT